MAQFLVSAAHKSSGKTTISIGLSAALSANGHVVQPFKKGPDYIDPLWLGQACGRPCYNLDFYLSDSDEIRDTYQQRSIGSEIQLIEGNKGLYDGLDLDGSNSNAALAKLLDAPVILVVDVRGMTRGIAPLILGYQQFDTDINIAGVILNQVRGSRHESKLRAVIEHYTDVPVLGSVDFDTGMEIVERHLGLMPSNENREAEDKIRYIGEQVANQVDLDKLIAVAGKSPKAAVPAAATRNTPPDIRIGIARDAAFGFYYPDDLDAFTQAGAELVPFNTLSDDALPDVDALLIGGGFPEMHMESLTANKPMLNAIHGAIEAGMPVYAECGGLMYLARGIRWDDRVCEMVGVIAGDVVMHERPIGRGYTKLKRTDSGLWPVLTSSAKDEIFSAHEFHYSSLENLDPNIEFAYEVRRGVGVDGKHDGIIYKNLLASYIHQRDVKRNHWTQQFVEFIRKTKHNIQPASNAIG
ncbi:MAG: cobyrinate a,c-diamide synthase [Acidiferrobacterales bacterium]|jgi:cobyrinic acid a,c-diamide synthase|nr:cobyrinate a,c-diamide synthase [Acidiferrobacterales bacterium]